MDNFSQKLATLHAVNIELSQADSAEMLYRLSIELGCLRLGFDRLGLWLCDQADPRVLIGTFGIDENGELRDERTRRITVQENSFHNMLRLQKTASYFNPQIALRDHLDRIVGEGSLAAAGLWNGLETIGLIYTDNLLRQEEIDEQQRDLLVLYAQILANLISRQRAEDDLRCFARHQLLLNEITRTALEQNNLTEILQSMVDRLGELFLADSCYLTLWDEARQAVIAGAVFGTSPATYQSIPQLRLSEKNLTNKVRETRQPLIIPDIQRSSYLDTEPAGLASARSLLTLPLTGNQQFLGAAIIAYHEGHDFTRDEIYIGEQAAQNIAMAILKARLLEESQRRATEAETLREAAAAVAGTLKRGEVIERILEQLNRVVPYDSACVLLPDGEEHVIVDARGFPKREEIVGLRFAVTAQTPNSIVYAQRKPYILEDAPAIYAAYNEPPHKGIRGWMGIPLLLHDELIGMLALDSHRVGTFTPDHARLASAFADQVAIALENTRLFEETQRLAVTDSLTDLHNRRHFMNLASAAFQHARRYREALSMIMFDIDHFKIVNDTCGHACGDRVLQAVAQECRSQLRETDVIGRYGGEEFIILLPRTPARHTPTTSKTAPPPAEAVAHRLRQAVSDTIIHGENAHLSVTISLGVAEMDETCFDVETLIQHADYALYEAKERGRNRVSVWSHTDNDDFRDFRHLLE
jgi:diguanylate cyclase (GGDEF)-like protein